MIAIAWKARPRWQKFALVLLILAGMLALGVWIATIVLRPHLPTHDEVVAQSRAQAELAGGAQIFATHCAACHEHAIGPWLGGRALDSATIGSFVRNGPAAMPAFPPSQVSDADIEAISHYLGTLPDKSDKVAPKP